MRKELLEQAETLDKMNQIIFVNELYNTSMGLNKKDDKKEQKAAHRPARMDAAQNRDQRFMGLQAYREMKA